VAQVTELGSSTRADRSEHRTMDDGSQVTHQSHRFATVAVAALVVLAGCGGDDGGAPRAPAPSAASGANTPAVVVIKDVRFTTAQVRIGPGDAVTFDNRDNQPHTATSDSGAPMPFDTDSIAAGATKAITFERAGTYTYHCSFHPFMTGTVVVG
jgi:plastocyanin